MCLGLFFLVKYFKIFGGFFGEIELITIKVYSLIKNRKIIIKMEIDLQQKENNNDVVGEHLNL